MNTCPIHCVTNRHELLRYASMDGVEYTQLEPGDWIPKAKLVQAGHWLLEYFETDKAIRARGVRPQGDVALLCYLPHSPEIRVYGKLVPQEHVMMRNHRFIVDDVMPSGSGGIAVRISKEAFAEIFAPILPRDIQQSLNAAHAFSPCNELLNNFIEYWRSEVLRHFEENSFTTDDVKYLCDEFFRKILFYWDTKRGTSFQESTKNSNHRLFKLMEDEWSTHHENQVTLTDLCKTLNCSLSTLYATCNEHVGMSAKQYARLFRLNGARRMLLTTEPRVGLVAETASQWGFAHLGRFSKYYRDFFGENPKSNAYVTKVPK